MQVMKDSHYYSRDPSSLYHAKKIRVTLRGHYFELYTASGVFSRDHIDPGTKSLCQAMKVPLHGNILDYGTGIGIIALVAAKESPNATIYASDVNPRAIHLARRNVKLNAVSNCRVVQVAGYDTFESAMFAAILSNPPYSAGWQQVKQMIAHGPKYLHSGGTMQLVCLQRKGGSRVKQTLLQTFGNVDILARAAGYRVFLAEKP